MPPIVVRDICKLRVSDLYINPFNVQTRDIQEGTYRAKVVFSGQDLILQIANDSRDSDALKTEPDYITSFQDQGYTCTLWEQTLTLWDLLQTHKRLGQPLANSFVWKVARAAASHIEAHSPKYDCVLSPSLIKISSTGAVYTSDKLLSESDTPENSSTSWPPPPEIKTLMYRLSPEKAAIWAFGCLMLDMVAVIPNVQTPREQGRRKPSIPQPQPSTFQAKLKVLRGLPDDALKDTIERSLNNDPSKRPSTRDILRAAKQQ
ncbi:hypothetical protein PoB_000086500 [Plakobranchus ocellatus]|uniref:Protein kinase domain-containing protein n=1 Tax=Plakobranchus ocellatus TaxID=259542 RepID=A0AAV3XU30_9GAST|nr:hypothetical protein PoB_000086500 [Plakobranchus ocellatus]